MLLLAGSLLAGGLLVVLVLTVDTWLARILGWLDRFLTWLGVGKWTAGLITRMENAVAARKKRRKAAREAGRGVRDQE